MQEIMTDKVGIFRTGKDLEQAVDELQKLLVRSRNIGLRVERARRQSGARHRLSRAEDAEARAVRRLRRAHAHREPRRAFPRGLPAPQRRRVAEAHARHVEGATTTLPTLAYEALDVKRMELPPGWRGYGAKDYIDHPDTAGAPGGGRRARSSGIARPLRAAARADALRAPAAAALRGRNERIDERFAGRRGGNGEPSRLRLGKRVKATTSEDAVMPTAPERRRPARRSACTSCATTRPIPASVPHMQTYELEQTDGHDAVHRADRDPREAGPVAAVRLRLPRRHLRQLRDGDQRPARPRLPHAHQERRPRDHAGAAAGVRADRRPVGQHRQVDARDERAAARPGCT